jgi:hypothetical protein
MVKGKSSTEIIEIEEDNDEIREEIINQDFKLLCQNR